MNQSGDSKKNDNFTDRRIFARLPVKLALYFSQRSREEENIALTVDISANGIGFISKTRFSPNTHLELWLDIPNQIRPLYITGKVIWSKPLEGNLQKWHTGMLIENVDPLKLGQIYQIKQKKINKINYAPEK